MNAWRHAFYDDRPTGVSDMNRPAHYGLLALAVATVALDVFFLWAVLEGRLWAGSSLVGLADAAVAALIASAAMISMRRDSRSAKPDTGAWLRVLLTAYGWVLGLLALGGPRGPRSVPNVAVGSCEHCHRNPDADHGGLRGSPCP